ncbi:MAG: hypothetical protein AB4352_11555 [Hormoscilla sp.]
MGTLLSWDAIARGKVTETDAGTIIGGQQPQSCGIYLGAKKVRS